jgi:hypothetical protein
VRAAGNGDQGVVRETQSGFKKLLEMGLIAGIAAMDDQRLGFAASAVR